MIPNVVRHGRIAGAAVLACGSFCSFTQAQNLLTNGSFDDPPGDLSGWTASSSSVLDGATRSTDQDHTGATDSGSARFAEVDTAFAWLQQCVSADAATYDLSASVKASQFSLSAAVTEISLTSFDGANCLGSIINSQSYSLHEAADWTAVSIESFDSGVGTHSLSVTIQTTSSGPSTNITAYWDDISLNPDDVFDGGFD